MCVTVCEWRVLLASLLKQLFDLNRHTLDGIVAWLYKHTYDVD